MSTACQDTAHRALHDLEPHINRCNSLAKLLNLAMGDPRDRDAAEVAIYELIDEISDLHRDYHAARKTGECA